MCRQRTTQQQVWCVLPLLPVVQLLKCNAQVLLLAHLTITPCKSVLWNSYRISSTVHLSMGQWRGVPTVGLEDCMLTAARRIYLRSRGSTHQSPSARMHAMTAALGCRTAAPEHALLHLSRILSAQDDHLSVLQTDVNRSGGGHVVAEAVGRESTCAQSETSTLLNHLNHLNYSMFFE